MKDPQHAQRQAEEARDALDADALALGLRIVRAEAPADEVRTYYLWPETFPAWRFFMECDTQWRHGFEGPTGLAWEAVQVRMDRLVPRKRQRWLWPLLEGMERGALRGWDERRREQQQRR